MAKFGLSTLEGIQSKEREHPLLSLSLSLWIVSQAMEVEGIRGQGPVKIWERYSTLASLNVTGKEEQLHWEEPLPIFLALTHIPCSAT
jgi:hypothetical protein